MLNAMKKNENNFKENVRLHLQNNPKRNVNFEKEECEV